LDAGADVVKSYFREEHLKGAPFGFANNGLGLERPERNKHSNLLRTLINYTQGSKLSSSLNVINLFLNRPVSDLCYNLIFAGKGEAYLEGAPLKE
jgi:hypothetical protein